MESVSPRAGAIFLCSDSCNSIYPSREGTLRRGVHNDQPRHPEEKTRRLIDMKLGPALPSKWEKFKVLLDGRKDDENTAVAEH